MPSRAVILRTLWLLCLVLAAAACGAREPAPIATPTPPIATAVPAETATATAVAVAPTETATPLAPSPTAVAPSATPEPAPPTATAVAETPATATAAPVAPAIEDAGLGRLALGMKVFEGEFAASLCQENDIFAFGYQANTARVQAAFKDIPVQNRMLMTPTLEGVEELLDRLPVEVAYLGYDLETWEATSAAEQEDPVAAVARARDIAHSRGLKLAIGPSRMFNERYGAQLAPLVDVYMPQAKAYQARMTQEEYQATMRDLFVTLRQANPEVKLFLDLSPSPKGVEQEIDDMLQCVRGVADLVDGVWVTFTPPETDRVGEFVARLRQ